MIDVDTAGSIGRRYRRQDEVGTPLCVTIDFDTLDDRAVTIRDRDTMAQDRVPIDKLLAELKEIVHVMTDDSYYELLGVEPSASRDELRSAYRSRVEKLEAAREGKGVTESSLQANREETARVRAAWNVLSDPFQRQPLRRAARRARRRRRWRRHRCRRHRGARLRGRAHGLAQAARPATPEAAAQRHGRGWEQRQDPAARSPGSTADDPAARRGSRSPRPARAAWR